jgi:ABC-type nitrate/sulfonate/bicarbonate transport system substrate-binding protein
MQHYTRSTFLAAAGAAALAPSALGAQQLAALRATSAIDDPATPFLYAMESGLFRKNGIDASIERSTSGAAAAASVVGGSFDVGKASIVSFLSAFVRNVPLIAIAPAGEYDSSRPNAMLTVKTDSTLRTGADLNGKTVAVSALNDLFSIAVRAWVDKNGGDSSTLKLVELPVSAAVAAIASGRIDAGVVVQPFLAQAVSENAIKAIADVPAALGTHHADSLWFTTTSYAEKNPDVVNRFMRTMREAAIYVNAHPTETAPLLIKFAKVKATDVGKVRVLQGTRLEAATMQPLIDAAAKYNVIPKRIDAKELIYANALK